MKRKDETERLPDDKQKVLMLASVASMIDQFNMQNIRLLTEMGYEVHVACNFIEGNTCDRRRVGKLQRRLEKMHVIWHQWDCPRSIRSVWKCCKAYWQLMQLTIRDTFVWMHCHSPVGGVLARMVAHRQKIRVIYTAHGFHFYQGAPLKNWLLYYPVEKLLSRWTDILITVNREDYQLAAKSFQAGQICCLPGIGIDTGRFQKTKKSGLRKKYGIPEEALLLLSVGELSRRKNHQIVLKAMARLSRPDVYYMICGQGNLRAQLTRSAKRFSVRSRVRMTGFLENVEDIYQHADVFVFPSVQEGMPVALMEAMAAGLPCVVSDIRGNRELIDEPGGGRRFAAKDEKELCDALRFMLNERRRKVYGAYNRRKIKDYDSSVVLPQMREIYKEMAGAGTCR